ncbi:MAG: DNA double-strand break repair nuclease NurA [Candidatus Anstonellales archaeon]
MNSNDIYERLKKYEFNKTEPETLRELVRSALIKGDIAKKRIEKFRSTINEVEQIFKSKGLIRRLNIRDEEVLEYKRARTMGIDGSFQYVGGFGGIWYVPISCAVITFEENSKHPSVRIAAEIEEINENQYPNVLMEASIRMLEVERKAIDECLLRIGKDKSKIIFIDGPIVDPPSYSEENYVKRRCETFLHCIEKEVLTIGCVKKPSGKFLINYISHKILENEFEKDLVNQFISDVHLLGCLFTKLYLNDSNGILVSTPFEIGNEDYFYQMYLNNGVRIFSVFMQKDPISRPIRLDIPQKINFSNNIELLIEKAVKATFAWLYPGSNIPLPIALAHNKCNVRKGCAKVLYEEIITRVSSPDPFDNIIKMKMM